jgi:tagatose 6-phosphate kinase
VILTVTLNPALDVTYRVDLLVSRSAMRVTEVHQRAGGKGLNVARVVAACGAAVCATGLAGGARGARGASIRSSLARAGVRDEFAAIAGETRQTVTIVSGDQSPPTELREPDPSVTAAEWERFRARYAVLTAVAAARRVPVIVDAGGSALRLACAAGEVDPDMAAKLASTVRIRKIGEFRS